MIVIRRGGHMKRRKFIKLMAAGAAGSLVSHPLARLFSEQPEGSRYLPPPQVNTLSSEIALNTRRSYHSGYSGALSDQILANLLWAASKAPITGANRIIYVARPDNVYRYDENQHDIIFHAAGNQMSEANCAFEIGVASDLAEDAGTALHYAHLAAISFWASTNNQPIGCPKESATTHANSNWNPALTVQMVNCHGLMSSVSGITSELVAISSDNSLPDPSTDGTVILENGFAHLPYGDQFASTDLTLQEISQLAWASYGNTPHVVLGSRAAITVASAIANYYLTERIYILRPEGVERYHIRLPGGNNTTRDHRIERVTDGDRRPQLRAAVSRIPQTAPAYFVFCAATTDRYQLIEAGYCAASALLQAASLDLQGYFTSQFSSPERTAIINALGIPSSDLPLVIFSGGQPLTGAKESNTQGAVLHLSAAPNPFTTSTKITYGLRTKEQVRLSIYDQSGRCVKVLVDGAQAEGNFSIVWNGNNNQDNPLPKGIYHSVLSTRSGETRVKLIKLE
jgi:hypothetical protein